MARSHNKVIHPNELLSKPKNVIAKVNDTLATKLAVIFGIAWTIWFFLIAPLVAAHLPPHVQAQFFFYSSGWIQLFALPLLVYVGNKTQAKGDAQSDAQHEALTHIALTVDEIKDKVNGKTG